MSSLFLTTGLKRAGEAGNSAPPLLYSRYSGKDDVSVGANLRAEPNRIGGVDRILRKHAGATDRSLGKSHVPRAARPGGRSDAGCLHASGSAVGKAGGSAEPPRPPNGHPFFEVLLNYVNVPEQHPALNDLHVETLPLSQMPSKFLMTLYVHPAGTAAGTGVQSGTVHRRADAALSLAVRHGAGPGDR